MQYIFLTKVILKSSLNVHDGGSDLRFSDGPDLNRFTIGLLPDDMSLSRPFVV